MKLEFRPFLVILALLSVPVVEAQTSSSDSPQNGSTESSPQDQSSAGPQPVYTHPQDGPSFGLLDEATSHNFIKLGMGASYAYDTNAAVFSSPKYSQNLGILNPSVLLSQTRPTLSWSLGAVGSLTTSSVPGYYTTAGIYGQGNLTWQINHRWQLIISETYLYTTDPFQQYTAYMGAPSYNQPNPTSYSPLGTTESNAANVDLSYVIGAHDSITFTGLQNSTSCIYAVYNSTTPSCTSSSSYGSAFNWYTWGGWAQYQHLFSSRFSAGGGYGFEAVDFGNGTSRSGIQSFQAFATYQLAPHMSVTGWIGPQYISTKNKVPIFCDQFGCFVEIFHNSSWNTAYGGSFAWNGQRNAAMINFSKAITNGGVTPAGGFGIVQLYLVRAAYTRQLSPRWSGNLSMLYGNNTSYASVSHYTFDSFTGYAGLVRQLTPTLSASVTYAYFYETTNNRLYGLLPKWVDNRFQFTLQYYWGHSLGR